MKNVKLKNTFLPMHYFFMVMVLAIFPLSVYSMDPDKESKKNPQQKVLEEAIRLAIPGVQERICRNQERGRATQPDPTRDALKERLWGRKSGEDAYSSARSSQSTSHSVCASILLDEREHDPASSSMAGPSRPADSNSLTTASREKEVEAPEGFHELTRFKGVYYSPSGASVLDLSNIPMVSEPGQMAIKFGFSEVVGYGVDQVATFVEHQVTELAEKKKMTPKEITDSIQILDLSRTHLDSKLFDKLVRSLSERNIISILTPVQFIDLSYNPLDVSIALSYYNFMNGRLHAPIISFLHTPIDKKEIRGALEKLYDVASHSSSDFSSQFIFIDNSYLSKASQSVQVYKTLVDEELLSPDWADKHRTFYRTWYKNLIKHREAVSARRLAHTVINPARAGQTRDPDDPEVQDEIVRKLDSLSLSDPSDSHASTSRTPSDHSDDGDDQ